MCVSVKWGGGMEERRERLVCLSCLVLSCFPFLTAELDVVRQHPDRVEGDVLVVLAAAGLQGRDVAPDVGLGRRYHGPGAVAVRC